MAYLHSESITIDHTKCGSSDSTNFPMLFNSTITNLKTIGNGGEVINSSGFDIIFSSAPNDFLGLNKLDFEIERYTATSGEYIAWVRVPTVSSSVNTVIYLYWGNVLISTSQENKTGTWNNNFAAVYHLSSAATINDSTTNGNNATAINGISAGAGQIDGDIIATAAGNSNVRINNASSLNPSSAMTIEAWGTLTSVVNIYLNLVNKGLNGGSDGYGFFTNNTAQQMIVQIGATQTFQSGTFSLGTFVHFVGTYDGANVILYINGVNNASSAMTGNIPQNTSQLYISNNASNGANYWNGHIDEVRVLSVALPADWITTEYNNQNSPSTFYTLGSEVNSGKNLLSILNAG